MKISCKCLNVTIESKGFNFEDLDLLTLEVPKNEFFKEPLGRVELIGIIKEQPMLVDVQHVGHWAIHRCLNCQMYTHALDRDKGAASLLVNKSLITDPVEIEELKRSEHFSPVFNIIINVSEDDEEEFTRLSGGGYAKHNAGVAALHQSLTNYLQRESALTEERVRVYTDQQYAALESVRTRAHRDHRYLTKLFAAMRMDNCLASATSNIVNSNTTSNNNIYSNNNFSNINNSGGGFSNTSPATLDHNTNPMAAELCNTSNVSTTGFAVVSSKNVMSLEHLSQISSSSRRISKVDDSRSNFSIDSEAMFPLEGIDDISSDNYHTDEDRSDTDESGSHDEGIHIPRRVGSFVYAKSLPIQVPMFGPRAPIFSEESSPVDSMLEDAEEQQRIKDNRHPMDIAASIKALAKSVHGDTIFGDLPKPRFSSQL